MKLIIIHFLITDRRQLEINGFTITFLKEVQSSAVPANVRIFTTWT